MPFDHALVDFLEHTYRHTALRARVDLVFRPDVVLLVVLVLGLAARIRHRSGEPVPSWLDDLRDASIAAILGLIVAVGLKIVFGRSWADPTYVRRGVDDLRWFAGEWTPQRGAFPSATACASSAAAAALWTRSSILRAPAAAMALLFSAIVVIQEYHWLSDAIAGILLGIAIGCVTIRSRSLSSANRLRNPSPRHP